MRKVGESLPTGITTLDRSHTLSVSFSTTLAERWRLAMRPTIESMAVDGVGAARRVDGASAKRSVTVLKIIVVEYCLDEC